MKNKNILLLGSTSFTGSHLLHHLADQYTFRNVGRQEDRVDVVFDIFSDDVEMLKDHLAWADVVINCFSNGDVDSCEENPAPSKKLNLEFPKALCDQQRSNNFDLIHFSSNAVYDGEHPLYSEDHEHLPVNIYGQLKSEADKYLLENSDRCTVLRPITMFGQLLGEQRHNPFSFFFERLINNDDIQAVNDVFVNMLHVDVLIGCVKNVIEKEIYGEFNISGDDVVNRYELVSMVKQYIPESRSVVKETDSSNFVTAARRPANTSFDNHKMKSILGVYPEPLSKTIERLVSEAISQKEKGESQIAA